MNNPTLMLQLQHAKKAFDFLRTRHAFARVEHPEAARIMLQATKTVVPITFESDACRLDIEVNELDQVIHILLKPKGTWRGWLLRTPVESLYWTVYSDSDIRELMFPPWDSRFLQQELRYITKSAAFLARDGVAALEGDLGIYRRARRFRRRCIPIAPGTPWEFR